MIALNILISNFISSESLLRRNIVNKKEKYSKLKSVQIVSSFLRFLLETSLSVFAAAAAYIHTLVYYSLFFYVPSCVDPFTCVRVCAKVFMCVSVQVCVGRSVRVHEREGE